MIKRSCGEIAKMCGGKLLGSAAAVVCGVCTDTRKIERGNLFVPIYGERFDGHDYLETAIQNGAAAAFWTVGRTFPECDIPLIMVGDTVKALGRLAAAYRNELKARFIGITGSNGKTSTKDFLAGILSAKYKAGKTMGNLNNNIGMPLTVLSFDEDTQMAVVEMGTSDFGEIDYLASILRPDVAILTNVGEAHLDKLISVEGVAKAKLEMVPYISKKGLFVYFGDQPLLQRAVDDCGCQCAMKTFGESPDCDLRLLSVSAQGDKIEFTTSGLINSSFTLDSPGRHNALNAMAAMLAADFMELSVEEISEGLTLIEKTKMRNEIISIGDITILNDAYKSNPTSVRAALNTFYELEGTRKLFVMGDMIELGPTAQELHREIGGIIDERKIDAVYAYGADSAYCIEAAAKRFGTRKALHFDDRDKLVDAVAEYCKEPCTLLFKASRALKFEELIEELRKKI